MWKHHKYLMVLLFLTVFSSLQAQRNQLEVLSELDWQTIESLDADALSKLPSDSPLLRMAYSQLFLRTPGTTIPPWYKATLADLRRRGADATPILLNLFDENPEKAFQAQLLQRIGDITPVNLAPYRQAARDLYLRQGLNLPARTCYAMAWFFAYHGTKEDIEIVKGLSKHPDAEVPLVLNPIIKQMDRRLSTSNTSQTSESARSVKHSSEATQDIDITSNNSEAISEIQKGVNRGWLVFWLVIFLALTIGFFFLRKVNRGHR